MQQTGTTLEPALSIELTQLVECCANSVAYRICSHGTVHTTDRAAGAGPLADVTETGVLVTSVYILWPVTVTCTLAV